MTVDGQLSTAADRSGTIPGMGMSLGDERAQAAADALPPLTDAQRRRLRALLNIDVEPAAAAA